MVQAMRRVGHLAASWRVEDSFRAGLYRPRARLERARTTSRALFARRVPIPGSTRVAELERRAHAERVPRQRFAAAGAGRSASWPRREKSIDSARMRAASWGAWKPIEFSASMKSA